MSNAQESTVSGALIPVAVSLPVEPSPVGRLLARFFGGKQRTTQEAYAGDLRDFALFARRVQVEDAVQLLLDLPKGQAKEVVAAYRDDLLARDLSPRSINRRVSTLRSLVCLAYSLDMIGWMFAPRDPVLRAIPSDGSRRETRGPGLQGVRRLMTAAHRRNDAKGIRDHAIMRLLFDCALRRAEGVSLDLEHVDLQGLQLSVLRKGYRSRIWKTIAEETRAALEAWIAVRGQHPGPLFVNVVHRPGDRGRRITGSGLYTVIRSYARELGIRATPHGFRHSSATHALDMGKSHREVQKLTDHKTVNMIAIYDDTRQDLGGSVTRLIAAAASLLPTEEE
jgi:integrase/recombinase XerC